MHAYINKFFISCDRIDRMCAKTTNVKGSIIPQGSVVVIPIVSLHHDPRFWKDPEEFDPNRYKACPYFIICSATSIIRTSFIRTLDYLD